MIKKMYSLVHALKKWIDYLVRKELFFYKINHAM